MAINKKITTTAVLIAASFASEVQPMPTYAIRRQS